MRRVHGALVGDARAVRARRVAGGARLVPRVPRRLLPAGRVPRAAARARLTDDSLTDDALTFFFFSK